MRLPPPLRLLSPPSPPRPLPASSNLSGLEAGAQYDRFIVKYRDGSAEKASSATMQRP